jgi:hypothetical protein
MIGFIAAFLLQFAGVDATPTPSANIAGEYAGQVLDVERGYIVFSTGDALRLAPDATFTDAVTGKPHEASVQPGQYADVTLDQNGVVTLIRISDEPMTSGKPEAEIPRQFVVQATRGFPNPDLIPPASRVPVSKLSPTERVTITVEVPPQTPFADDIYISTDTSGWNPQAVKMQRIDGRHFRVTMDVLPGSLFRYLFTRGSWPTVESDAAGLRRSPRRLSAEGAVSLAVDATVQRWVDLP